MSGSEPFLEARHNQRSDRECIHVAQRKGFGVHPPDRFQLMDYKARRSNAHAPKMVVTIALSVAVNQLEVASFMGSRSIPHQRRPVDDDRQQPAACCCRVARTRRRWPSGAGS